jgi:hypothetical protein
VNDAAVRAEGSVKTLSISLLAAYLLLALGLSTWFYLRFPIDPNVSPLPTTSYRAKAALAVGFLDAIPALLSVGAVYDVFLRLRRRDRLARSVAGLPPSDGKREAFCGRIRRDGPPLVAPLSGRRCVLYRYVVTARGGTTSPGRGSSQTTSSFTLAEGFAMTPVTIEAVAGSVKLLTLVEPECPADRLALEQVADNYAAHAATARLQPSTERSKAAVLRALRKRPKAEIRYDLGPDSRHIPTAAPLTIEETIVQEGDTVAVFGKYSAALGGVVDDPDGVEGVRLYKGPIEVMQRRLTRSALWFVLGSVVWLALAAVGAWAFLTYGPPYIGWKRFRTID